MNDDRHLIGCKQSTAVSHDLVGALGLVFGFKDRQLHRYDRFIFQAGQTSGPDILVDVVSNIVDHLYRIFSDRIHNHPFKDQILV